MGRAVILVLWRIQKTNIVLGSERLSNHKYKGENYGGRKTQLYTNEVLPYLKKHNENVNDKLGDISVKQVTDEKIML